MCYIHNFFSMLLMTFCALLMIISLIVKVVKDFKEIVFVNRFDLDFIKKVIYFFAIFFISRLRFSSVSF